MAKEQPTPSTEDNYVNITAVGALMALTDGLEVSGLKTGHSQQELDLCSYFLQHMIPHITPDQQPLAEQLLAMSTQERIEAFGMLIKSGNYHDPNFVPHILYRYSMILREASKLIEEENITQLIFPGSGSNPISLVLAQKFPHIKIAEIDQGGTARKKQDIIKTLKHSDLSVFADAAERVICIDHNLATKGLKGKLSNAGFDPHTKTLAIATGVIMYLPKECAKTLCEEVKDFLGNQGHFFISYKLPDRFTNDSDAQDPLNAHGDNLLFSATEKEMVQDMLGPLGFTPKHQATSAALKTWGGCKTGDEKHVEDFLHVKASNTPTTKHSPIPQFEALNSSIPAFWQCVETAEKAS